MLTLYETIMILMGFYLILILNYIITFHSISLVNDYTIFIADVPLALLFLILTAHHQGDLKKIAASFKEMSPSLQNISTYRGNVKKRR